MKFKLKAIVAAVAFAAAGHAMADIQAGNSNASSPNGELVFFAYGFDASGNVATYVKDLGTFTDAFAATPSYALTNLSADANWTAFSSASLVGDKYWGVFGTQKLSASTTAANAISLFTTAAGDDVSGVSGLSNTKLTNAFSNANNAIAAINVGGTNYAANSSYFYTAAPVDAATQSGNLGAYLSSDFATSGVFINSTNVIGTTTAAHFFDVSRGSGNGAAGIPTVADVNVNGAWHLVGNNLDYTVAAVPEPETYGMLAAGLLMLGAVARRRKV